jgi:hypothetical protein
VLTRCLQSGDDRVAMMAAQAILDRGYGKPTQSIDVREDGPTVCYYAEMPVKDKTTEEWLKGNAIVAAFEVESTTSVYSGLLRMSDLLALQPNLDIKLFLVAPDERRGKVEQEIQRPTFKIREKPMPQVCGFLAFSKLMEKVEAIQRLGVAKSLRADFLESTAEYFETEG